MENRFRLESTQSEKSEPDRKWIEWEFGQISGLYHLIYHDQWEYEYIGEICTDILGCEQENFLSTLLALKVTADSSSPECTMQELLSEITKTDQPIFFTARRFRDSVPQYLSGNCELSRRPDGSLHLIGHLADVTVNYADNQRQLLDRNGLLQAAQLVFPEMLSINLSSRTYRMIQYYQPTTLGTPREGMLEDMLNLRRQYVYPEDLPAFDALFSADSLFAFFSAESENRCQLTYRRSGADGIWHWVETIVVRQDNPYNEDILVFVVSHSVDEQKAKDNAYHYAVQRADYDDMTSVLRKESGRKYIEQYLSSPQKCGGVLLALDLDDLKYINDHYGHIHGDKAIIHLAETLKSHFRTNDIISRIGGDEFVVFLPGAAKSISAVRQSLERLLNELRSISVGDDSAIGLRCSIGCAVEKPGEDSFLTLYHRADTALYQVKRNNKNSFAFFETNLPEEETPNLISQNLPANQFAGLKRTDYSAIILDHTESACYLSDPDTHEMYFISKAGMEGLGLNSPEEYVGKKCYEVVYGLDSPCPFCTTPYLTLDKHYRWQHNNPKNGRWYDITDSLTIVDGKQYRMEIARDISIQKDMMRSNPKHQATMEDVLFYCLDILVREKDMFKSTNAILQAIGEYYQAKRAYIFEYDLEYDTMSNTFEWCSEGTEAAIDDLQNLPREIVADWEKKFEKEGGFVIQSLQGERDPDSEEYRILESQGIESLLASPLYLSDQMVGFIGVDDPSRNPGNLMLLRSTSSFIAEELEKRRLMAELKNMSYIDQVTGLGNRNLYNRRCKEYQFRSPDSLGYLSIDINGLREINETYDHDRGDEIIIHMADILRERYPECAYRIGSDEFAVFCDAISHADFKETASSLRHTFQEYLGGRISVGYAWSCDNEHIDLHILTKQADEMRMAEKQAYYHMAAKEGSRALPRGAASTLLKDLTDGLFHVYYQPQHDLQTGLVIGSEALVRKQNPDGSIISPGIFLPLYEMSGVISHLDLFVLRTACQDLVEWQKQGYDLMVSVNLSRITLLESDIVETIRSICADCGVHPSSINLEVTESIGKIDIHNLQELTDQLHAAGFRISLDDFGSQYSNLAILTEIAFDEIKLDRSLVMNLETNEKSRVVVEGCLTMCRSLEHAHSLAEGIETEAQLEILKNYHCNLGQGYYFSRPLPKEKFEEYVKAHS